MTPRDQQKIIGAARAGGVVCKNYFGKVLSVEEKTGANDFRTEADLGSEKAILTILEKEFPTYSIYSEECGFID